MSKPQPVSDILIPLLKRLGLDNKIQIVILQDRWDAFVGFPVAAHTFPYQLKFRKLYLYVDSSAWMSHLSFLKEELKNKINREAEEVWVQEIILKIGTIDRQTEEESIRPGVEDAGR
jgi:predicted nucleic acid-binding Zn ribbon protein